MDDLFKKRKTLEKIYALEKSKLWIERGQLSLNKETDMLTGEKARLLFCMAPSLDQKTIDIIKMWCVENEGAQAIDSRQPLNPRSGTPGGVRKNNIPIIDNTVNNTIETCIYDQSNNCLYWQNNCCDHPDGPKVYANSKCWNRRIKNLDKTKY